MIKSSKNKKRIKGISKKLKKIPKTLAEHLFLSFFGFLIIDLVIGGFIFYKYYLLIEDSEINITEKILEFEESNYQEVLNQWQTREKALKTINSRKYFNPFKELRNGNLSTSTEEATATEETTSIEESTSTSPESSPPVSEESEPEPEPEPEPGPFSSNEALLAARNLFEFFMIKDGKFPYFWDRAIIWENKGFGSRDYYYGSEYQNILLLETLKKDLTRQ